MSTLNEVNNWVNMIFCSRRFLQKERRRQAGVIVTSSTSSTVDSNDLEAELRRKRNQRPLTCCWWIGSVWRKCKYSWCICAQNYLYRVPCMKYRKTPWTEDEIHDMQMMWAWVIQQLNDSILNAFQQLGSVMCYQFFVILLLQVLRANLQLGFLRGCALSTCFGILIYSVKFCDISSM